jgi:HEAT repeat protein
MRVVPTVAGCLLALTLAGPLAAAGPGQAVKKAAPPSAQQKVARDTLAGLENEAGWQERMRALVSLTKAGPDAVGPLVETLRKGSPRNRTFAAWVLGILADPAARLALENALDDPEQAVRSQAILALRMLGPLKLTDRQRQGLALSNFHVRAHLEFALARKDDPNPAAIRKALQDYDPARIDTARVGQLAPDFSLADLSGKTRRLGQIREGKGVGGPQAVVLVFLRIDH